MHFKKSKWHLLILLLFTIMLIIKTMIDIRKKQIIEDSWEENSAVFIAPGEDES